MIITSDLRKDFYDCLRAELLLMGCKSDKISDGQIGILYWNYLIRAVIPQKRKVHLAKNFLLPKKSKKGFTRVKKHLEEGKDLRPFLSRKIMDLDYDDLLLNEWGIHHLHLGRIINGNELSGRTGELLFVKFDACNAYCIGIYNHNNFSDKQLLKIIHVNWPNLIQNHRLIGCRAVGDEPTNRDISDLRKAGVNSILNIGDATYSPTGCGVATSGRSNKATMFDTTIHTYLKGIEQNLIEVAREDLMCRNLWSPLCEEVVFRLNKNDNIITIYNNEYGLRYEFQLELDKLLYF